MNVQNFKLNDGSNVYFPVLVQRSKKYDAMTIQISKVAGLSAIEYGRTAAIVPYRFIYEEIDRDDLVIYARFMGAENIARNYPWAFTV